MPPPRLPETLEQTVKAEFRTALADEPFAVAELGTHTLNRLAPPNWTLEWSLPGWLGATLGLDPATVASLTLANVYGLTTIKLHDDLLDGEVAADDQPVAPLLAAALHRKWLLTYARLLPGESLFWDHFEPYMVQWTQATWASRRGWSTPFADWGDAELLRLAHRGAPLKSCAAAACLLAHQGGRLAQFETALDRLLAGAVLLDHAVDWSDDLEGGHFNAFVAYCSSLPQSPLHRAANRRAVLAELAAGNAGRPYFRWLRHELRTAQVMTRAAGCEPLARYLTWLLAAAQSYRQGLVVTTRAQLPSNRGAAV